MSNKKHILMKKQKLEYSPNINKLRYFVKNEKCPRSASLTTLSYSLAKMDLPWAV